MVRNLGRRPTVSARYRQRAEQTNGSSLTPAIVGMAAVLLFFGLAGLGFF